DLFADILRPGAAYREGSNQSRKLIDRDSVGKVNARQPGGGQQLRKTALGLAGFQRNTIQQQLIAGNSQQEIAFLAFWQSILQFRPRAFELAFGALVLEPVQANVLNQNIEAVHEGAG